jgi:hypothetical protein
MNTHKKILLERGGDAETAIFLINRLWYTRYPNIRVLELLIIHGIKLRTVFVENQAISFIKFYDRSNIKLEATNHSVEWTSI